MATFVWDEAVRWPPPAHILLGYDIVSPTGVVLSRRETTKEEKRMPNPVFAMIVPLSDGGLGIGGGPAEPPIFHPGHPDHGLPSGGHPGNRPPGSGGGHPSQPIHHPGHPDHGLPSQPGHPDQGLPPSSGRPDQGLPPGKPIPPNEIDNDLPDPPEAYADMVVIAVKKPNEPWKYVAYETGTIPDNALPGGGTEHPGNRPPGSGAPPHPDNKPPAAPARPDQGLPPAPAHPGNRPPPAPARPGTPLPPTAGSKPIAPPPPAPKR